MCVKFQQFLAGIIGSFGSFCFGVTIGWPAPSYKKIVLAEGLGYPIDEDQYYWICAFLIFGGIISFIPGALLAKVIGPKTSMTLAVFPGLLGWFALVYGNHHLYAIGGRFLHGISVGNWFVCSRLYLTEIAETKVRGMMGVLYQILLGFGVVYAYSFGPYLSTLHFNITCATPFGVFLIGLMIIPESPHYYVHRDQILKARRALKRLRSERTDIDQELQDIIKDDERLRSKDKIIWKTLFSGVHRKSFLLAGTLLMLHQMSGITCFTFFITTIFIQAKIGIPPEYVTLLYGCVPIPLIFIAFGTIDLVGRRLLLIISGSLMTILMTICSIHFTLYDLHIEKASLNWIPAFCIILYCCCFQFGLGSLSFVISAELFEDDVRNIALALCAIINWSFNFLTVTTFFPIKNTIGLGPTVAIFAFFDLFSVIFTLCFLPETKGKTFAEIQLELEGRKNQT